jgi:hypothetical protein
MATERNDVIIAGRTSDDIELVAENITDRVELYARYPISGGDLTECLPPLDRRGDFFHHAGRADLEIIVPVGWQVRVSILETAIDAAAHLGRSGARFKTGFALRIGQRAALVPDPGGRVYGLVMDFTHAEVEQLYAEPSVSMYRPEAVIVELDGGGTIAALCFNLTAPPRPEESNAAYAVKLRDLARQLGLPAGYIAAIG